MNEYYILKHKDVPCGLMAIDAADGSLTEVKIYDKEYAPFLGNADIRKMKRWWDMRAVPGARKDMEQVIRQAGCQNSRTYLAKNLALSISDTYWICPIDMELSWADVNLYRRVVLNDGIVPYHNMSSYDPNASLGGQMDKIWDVSADPPVLRKTAWKYYGQQSINEKFAAEVHTRQAAGIPFVSYSIMHREDHGVIASCDAFTSPDIEFVPAYEVLESEKHKNEVPLYEEYIRICRNHGLDEEHIRDFMDYQTATDFVISNTDEHLMNFGVLRDANSMKLLGAAPVFDSGNSMFYADERQTPYDRAGLLERRITAFHDREEKMLSHIRNKMIVKCDQLPSRKEVQVFYEENGLPAERASFVADNYALKCEMFREFQDGKKISLYREKRREAP